MFSCDYCRIFKITWYDEHLPTVASIRCYFDTNNLKQSGFCTTFPLKFLFQNENSYIYSVLSSRSQNTGPTTRDKLAAQR